ncbi:MAG: glycerol-3-phosphate responsive antiterminator [Thermodesulfobacteriota bacterium]
MDFLMVLEKKPLIAAFRDIKSLCMQNVKLADILFILGGTIFDLSLIVAQAKKYQKLVLVDIDLVKGIGKDAAGIQFLAQQSRIDGIITTRSNLIKSAQKEGLIAIQRVFVLDSESLVGGLGAVEKSGPDAVEILPALILPKVMNRIKRITSIPVIAGGLVTEKKEVNEILSCGAIGVSTTALNLINA